jgi:hypothetical protein
MKNTTIKISIPVHINNLYEQINAPETLNAQAIAQRLSGGGEALTIRNKAEYDEMSEAVRLVSNAVKLIEATRKEVTHPADAFKKQCMALEKAATTELIDFISDAKIKMLDYHNELEFKKREAEQRLRAEAEAALKQAQSVNDIMAAFTDKLFTNAVETNQTKNVRTKIKARISGEVDWAKVLGVLFGAGELEPERLIERLPKAMEFMHVDNIDGIELYEHKTQVIR